MGAPDAAHLQPALIGPGAVFMGAGTSRLATGELDDPSRSARLRDPRPHGRTVIHVYGAVAPGPGFEPAEPDLEDVYFSTMAGHIGRRHRQHTA